MTNTIKLSFVALSFGAFVAGAAQAEDVRVSIIGKDPRAVHAEFIRAAHHVCASENTAITYRAESDRDACVRDTIAKADNQYRQMKTQQVAMARGE